MKTNVLRRMLSLVLVLVILAGLALPASAADSGSSMLELHAEQIDNSEVTADVLADRAAHPDNGIALFSDECPPLADNPNESVRVSIVLEERSAIEAGYAPTRTAGAVSAEVYRDYLETKQDKLAAKIEETALDGQDLDVVWNLTLAANVISANVPAGAIEAIAAMDGVKAVERETRYSPDVVSIGGDYQPNMAVSGQMTGATQAWESGYTGAGTRIAVVDTGLDTDHQSFDPDAFLHALEEDAAAAGMSYADYAASKDLMGVSHIADKLDQLNAYKKQVENGQPITAEDLYINPKAAFGYNYIDGNLNVTHDGDTQGEHGSHVAGISTANRYIRKGGDFVDALETVSVAGNAPDAQIMVMKVFGANGGAYDSDILAGIEDALVLGADSINLSLGSGNAGFHFTDNERYQTLMENLVDTNMVMINSAGNSGYWAENAHDEDPYTSADLYSDGVNFDTVGSPASFTNSFSVASVDNAGYISPVMKVGGQSFGYTEDLTDAAGFAYPNLPLTTLDTSADGSGTDYEFLMIDGYGTEAEYEGMDLTDKVVFCSRGNGVNFYEKANNAAKLGAKAVVIYNNEPGTLHMDLVAYAHTAPVVSISLTNSQLVRQSGTKHTTAGGLDYYTGTVTICGKSVPHMSTEPYMTMSSFSSWGVPGDLSLKPEITAPGGGIYSVNGLPKETDRYELMSGTSMAAPQVAGMAAQLRQYQDEENVHSDILNDRALVNSLLLSTASPMKDANGNFYPVFQQGAGLANVNDAITTPVHLTVDGQPDGKVKVELKDDPQKTGSYRFSFQLHNLTDSAYSYQLSADVFTQNVYTGDDGLDYLSTATRGMDAVVRFLVNGQDVTEGEDLTNYDFNADGLVTRADAQLLLDHVVKGAKILSNQDHTDFNGDGKVTTYDVHLFLNLMLGMVEVPAGSSITVDVEISLSAAEKARLDRENPVGAYVEAYVHAAPVTTEEGLVLPTLGIPVLGFYGSWGDSPMFDVGSWTDYVSGDGQVERSYLGNYVDNTFFIVYGDDPRGFDYHFGGNPVGPDPVYMPERNAINTERGDLFSTLSFTAIRNFGASRFTYTDTTDGANEVLFSEDTGAMPAAYFVYSMQRWMNAPMELSLQIMPQMEEGDTGLLTLQVAPEYYVNDDGSVRWDELGQGSKMEMAFAVDNTAPSIIGDPVVDEANNVLKITAKDNRYLAGVNLLDVSGAKLLASAVTPADAKPGEEVTLEIPLEDVNGYRFILQVLDYATNAATYKLGEQIGNPDPLPATIAFDENNGYWVSFKKDGWYWRQTKWNNTTILPYAGTAVGRMAFLTDDSGILYVAPADDLGGTTKLCALPYVLTDMAYDAENDILYGATEDCRLVTINKLDGTSTVTGTIPGNNLAYDGKGNFYCSKLNTDEVYTFTLETLADPVLVCDVGLDYYNLVGIQPMEYDSVSQKLLWCARIDMYGAESTNYYEINPAEKTFTTNYGVFNRGVSALLCPDWEADMSWADETDEATCVLFDKDAIEAYVGKQTQITAHALPWTLSNQAVEFTSLDESIVTVDRKGMVTGVAPGTTTIRAASVLDSSVYADCTVTVKSLDVTLTGAVQDAEGTPTLYTWNMAEADTWTAGLELDDYVHAMAEIPGENAFYQLSSRGIMHKKDLTTAQDIGDTTNIYAQENYMLWDLAYSEMYSERDGAPRLYGIRDNALVIPFDPMNPELIYYPLPAASFVTGIAVGGTEEITYLDDWDYPVTTDSEIVYLMDDESNIWKLNVFTYTIWDFEQGKEVPQYDMLYSIIRSNLNIKFRGYLGSAYSGYSSMVMGDDGALYVSAFDGTTNKVYRLVYNESSMNYEGIYLGSFGQDVWPAALLHVSSNEPEAAQAPAGTQLANQAFDWTLPQATETQDAPGGSLNAISVESQDSASAGRITVDTKNHTVTVPVDALDSTNGLFQVDYDSDVLTLLSAEGGAMLTSVDDAEKGSVRVGYASADAVTAVAATLKFSYQPKPWSQKTELDLTVRQDGQSEAVSQDQITVTLPARGTLPIGKPGSGSSDSSFVDVNPGDWFYDDVMDAVDQGLMNGVSDTRFAPNEKLTRAMLVTILHRAEGKPGVTFTNIFNDVENGKYYSDAVIWAADNGIVKGSHGMFLPDNAISRQELATILWRYAQYKGYDVRANGITMPDFDDRDRIADWAGEAMSWAYTRGILKGNRNLLNPEGSATRAEAAAMLVRFGRLELTNGVSQPQ